MSVRVFTIYTPYLDALHLYDAGSAHLGTLAWRGEAWRRLYGKGLQVLASPYGVPTLAAAILRLLGTCTWLVEEGEGRYLAGSGPRPEPEAAPRSDPAGADLHAVTRGPTADEGSSSLTRPRRPSPASRRPSSTGSPLAASRPTRQPRRRRTRVVVRRPHVSPQQRRAPRAAARG